MASREHDGPPIGAPDWETRILKVLRDLHRFTSSQGKQEEFAGRHGRVEIASPVQYGLRVWRDPGISAMRHQQNLLSPPNVFQIDPAPIPLRPKRNFASIRR